MSEVMSETASRSSVARSSGSGSTGLTGSSLTRLVLPKKQLLVGEKPCLPSGDCLPAWNNLPLSQKLPAFRVPEGALELSIKPLGRQAYINRKRVAFDLTDPNNYCIDTQYNALTDSHLRKYLSSPVVKKRLLENGEVTLDDRVKYTLKDFNKYRIWLKHVGLLHVHKEQEEEMQKEANMKNLECGDTMGVADIEHRLHEEQVRQRQVQHREAEQVKRRTQLFDMERRHEMTKLQREYLRSTDNELRQQKQRHREHVFKKASRLQQQMMRRKRENLQRKIQRHDDFLKELEETRVDDTAHRIREEWERRKANQRQQQEEIILSFQTETDRAQRYRKLFTAEMNKRWRAQADALDAKRQRARQNRQNEEEWNSRYLARKFVGSPQINPQRLHPAVTNEPPDASGSQVDVKTDDGQQQDYCQSSAGSPPAGNLSSSIKIPPLMTVHIDKRLMGEMPHEDLAVESPLMNLGLNIRLHPLKDEKSAEEVEKTRKALAGAYRQVSGRSVAYIPGMKKPRKKGGVIITEESIGSESEEGDLLEQQSQSGETEIAPEKTKSLLECLSLRDRKDLEEVLNRLLSDLNSGRLEQDDLVSLAACCAFLTETQLTEEEATSTTSLVPPERQSSKHLGEETEEKESVTSVSSGSLDRFVEEALMLAIAEEERKEEEFCKSVVDDTIRTTVSRLTQDLHDGTLSRGDVREIGSAVASVLVGEIRSDSSVMAEEMLVPTLRQLLQDVEDIDEGVLDQTLASLLLSYHQVTRRLDKLVWQVIKDFVVEVLLRTKLALVHGDTGAEEFLEKVEACKTTPLHQEMELPRPHELVSVLATGILKLTEVKDLCPVLCDLMKIVLDLGKPLLLHRDGPDAFSLPDIDSVAVEKIGETACGLELALEVAATVADGLYRDMLVDAQFEEILRLSLAPSLFLALLASWGEMDAAVPKETVALQTFPKELPYLPSLGEFIVLIGCERLFNDATNEQLPIEVITHLALHLAEFPALVQLSTVLDPDERGRVKLPPYVIRKITCLSAMVQSSQMPPEDMEKLLAVLLHIYFREVLMPQGGHYFPQQQVPHVLQEEEGEAKAAVTQLVKTLSSMLLHNVLNQVVMQLNSHAPEECMDVSVPWEVVQMMAERGLRELKEQLRIGLTPAHYHDTQLKNLMAAASLSENATDQPSAMTMAGFLTHFVRAVEKDRQFVQEIEEEEIQAVRLHFRKRFGKMARDIIKLFTGMAVLHQHAVTTSPEGEKMVTFLVSLLLELRSALYESVLSAEVISDFLHVVADELCPLELTSQPESEPLGRAILDVVNDIEWRGSRSKYFVRLVRHLSQLSLDPSQQRPEVAEGMAATAHMLTSLSPAILSQFVQTTLLSLLHSIRGSHSRIGSITSPESAGLGSTQTPTTQTGTPDATNNRRFTPMSSADSKKSSSLLRMPAMPAATAVAATTAAMAAAAPPIPDSGTPQTLVEPALVLEDCSGRGRSEGEGQGGGGTQAGGDCQSSGEESEPARTDAAVDESSRSTGDSVAPEEHGPPCGQAETEGDGEGSAPCEGTRSVPLGAESPGNTEWQCTHSAHSDTPYTATARSVPLQPGTGNPQGAVSVKPSRGNPSKETLHCCRVTSNVVLDQESQMEIFHETDIVTHIAIQTTLERLGAFTLPQDPSRTPSPTSPAPPPAEQPAAPQGGQMVSILVDQFDNPAAASPDFTDLDPAILSYAKDLMQHVTERMETEPEVHADEEGRSATKLESRDMAAIIINETLKSVETEIAVSIPQTKMDKDQLPPQVLLKPLAVSLTSLSDCLMDTLNAVHGELDILHPTIPSRTASISDTDVQSPSSSSRDPVTLRRARKIVAFLLQRVEQFTSPKMEVALTGTSSDVDPSKQERKMSIPVTTVLSETVLQTFGDVLHDMLEQNKFFSHEELQKTLHETSTVLLPSLPFLLDEYILSNLQRIAMQLTKEVPGMESPSPRLSAEAYHVAFNFHTVLKEMLSHVKSREDLGTIDAEKEDRTLFVLTVLNKAITRILEDPTSTVKDNLVSTQEESSLKNQATASSDSGLDEFRTRAEVESDLHKLLVSLGNIRKLSKQMTDSSEAVHAEKKVVSSAIQQIIDSLHEDKVSEVVLGDLCKTLLPQLPQDESRYSKISSLMTELYSLKSTLLSKQISRTKLSQAAADIDLLEKRRVEDPRLVAGAIQRASFSVSSSSTHYLKMALEDLLIGLNKGTMSSVHAGAALQQGEGALQQGEWALQQGEGEDARGEIPTVHTELCSDTPKEKSSSLEESGTLEDIPLIFRQSRLSGQADKLEIEGRGLGEADIASRTISKTEIDDGSLNRLDTHSFVYPSKIVFSVRSSSTASRDLSSDSQKKFIDHHGSKVSFDELSVSPNDSCDRNQALKVPGPGILLEDSLQTSMPDPGMCSAHENLTTEEMACRVKSKAVATETSSDTGRKPSPPQRNRHCLMDRSFDAEEEEARSDTYAVVYKDPALTAGRRASYPREQIRRASFPLPEQLRMSVPHGPPIEEMALPELKVEPPLEPIPPNTATSAETAVGAEGNEEGNADPPQSTSKTSKKSGSEGSLEAPEDDWNRSAIRAISENDVSDIDNVYDNQTSRQDAEVVSRHAVTERTKVSNKRRGSRNRSSKRTANSQQLLRTSEAFAVATYSQSVMVVGRTRKTNLKTKNTLPPGQKIKKRIDVNEIDLTEPTTAVQEYGNRPPRVIMEEGAERSELSEEVSNYSSDRTHAYHEPSLQNTNTVNHQDQSAAPHSKQTSIMSSTNDENNCSEAVRSVVAHKDKPFKKSGRPIAARKSSKPGVASRGEASRGSSLLQEERILRAQMKAFSLGFSIFNAEEKERLRRGERRKDTKRPLPTESGTSGDNSGTQIPHPPIQPRPVVRRRSRHASRTLSSDQNVYGKLSTSFKGKTVMTPSSQYLFEPRPPPGNGTYRTQRHWSESQSKSSPRLSENAKTVVEGTAGKQQKTVKVPDSVLLPAPLSGRKVVRGKCSDDPNLSNLKSAHPPKQTRSQGTGIMVNVMEWDTGFAPAVPRTQTDIRSNETIETLSSVNSTSSGSSDPEHSCAGITTETDRWSPSNGLKSVSTSPLCRDSQSAIIPTARPKESLTAKLPSLSHTLPATLAELDPTRTHRSTQESVARSSDPTVKGQAKRNNGNHQNNVVSDNSGNLQSSTLPCSDMQPMQQNKESPGTMSEVPEGSSQTSARRRVKLFHGGTLQMPSIPRPPVCPRPPDKRH